MEIIAGIFAYILFVFFFILFGKFSKECDLSMRDLKKN